MSSILCDLDELNELHIQNFSNEMIRTNYYEYIGSTACISQRTSFALCKPAEAEAYRSRGVDVGIVLSRAWGLQPPQFYRATAKILPSPTFKMSMNLSFTFFSQYDGFCPARFFDTAHCWHFGSLSPQHFFSGTTTLAPPTFWQDHR